MVFARGRWLSSASGYWSWDLCMCCLFFQAEDGIRDATVTGVQTCAFRSGRGLRCQLLGKLEMLNPGGSVKDRKSTRLNSSHGSISYAVFCLKKKKHSVAPPFSLLQCHRIAHFMSYRRGD